MALTELFLRSLGYSAWAEFDDSSPTHIQPLILWLENTKIRQYPLDGRAQLKTKNPVDWEAAFKRYLVDLGCPLEWGEGSSNSRIIHWLLSHAIGLDYDDNRHQYNDCISQVSQESISPEDWAPPRLLPFADAQSQETQEALRDVLTALHVKPPPSSRSTQDAVTAEDIYRAKSVLESQVLPTLEEAERQPGATPSSAAALAGLPLGFSTGDASLDVAATVLRLLYIKDLRLLQTQIDEAIVAQQELTANPRADAAAGRVGR